MAMVFLLSAPPLRAQETPVYPLPFVDENAAKTHLIHYVAPVYPAEAKRKCQQGRVILELMVSDTGAIVRVKIINGPDALAESATVAARQWVYEPYLVNGRPTKYKTKATVPFRIGQSECPRNTEH